jgi:hypothetical protein
MSVSRYCNWRRQKCDQAEDEKILKYKEFAIEIRCMWDVKTELIPLILEATVTMSKSLTKYLSKVPPKYDIKYLQTTAILALHTYCGKYWCKVQNIERGK